MSFSQNTQKMEKFTSHESTAIVSMLERILTSTESLMQHQTRLENKIDQLQADFNQLRESTVAELDNLRTKVNETNFQLNPYHKNELMQVDAVSETVPDISTQETSSIPEEDQPDDKNEESDDDVLEKYAFNRQVSTRSTLDAEKILPSLDYSPVCYPTEFVWKLDDLSELHKLTCGWFNEEVPVLSCSFAVNGYHSILAQVKLMVPNGNLSVSFASVHSECMGMTLNPPYPRITYTYMKTISDGDPKIEYEEACEPHFDYCLTVDKKDRYITSECTSFMRMATLSKLVKDESFDIKVKIDFPHFNEQATTYNGILIWRLNNFKDKFQQIDNYQTCYYSRHFYTSEQGYRVKVGLRPFVKPQLEIHILSGPFDAQLAKTPHFKVNITAEKNFNTIPVICNHVFRDFFKCIKLSNELSDYVHNDKLVLKIVVNVVES